MLSFFEVLAMPDSLAAACIVAGDAVDPVRSRYHNRVPRMIDVDKATPAEIKDRVKLGDSATLLEGPDGDAVLELRRDEAIIVSGRARYVSDH